MKDVVSSGQSLTCLVVQGCINDAKCMQYLLASRFGFEESHIRLMTDDQAGRYRPTKQNILEGMRWLVEGAQPGTSLFFHFSGKCFILPNMCLIIWPWVATYLGHP